YTMAMDNIASLADGDLPEPIGRVACEEEIVRIADRLIANTDEERRELIDLYGADPARVEIVHPGVDLSVFGRSAPDDEPPLIVFAGRIQPLKAPDLVLRASALIDVPHRVAVIGGASGSGLARPTELQDLARDLGIGDRVEFVPTVSQRELADWYSRAAVVCVPSY